MWERDGRARLKWFSLRKYHVKSQRSRRFAQTPDPCLLTKPSPVLTRVNKSPHQLGPDEIALELIQLIQPEVVAVKVCVRRVVGTSAQITEVLRQYEGAVGFGLDQG